jgi:hypothetical protein
MGRQQESDNSRHLKRTHDYGFFPAGFAGIRSVVIRPWQSATFCGESTD